jgi:hypothetical protein
MRNLPGNGYLHGGAFSCLRADFQGSAQNFSPFLHAEQAYSILGSIRLYAFSIVLDTQGKFAILVFQPDTHPGRFGVFQYIDQGFLENGEQTDAIFIW